MNDQEQDLKINTLENNQLSMAEKLDDLKTTMVNGFEDIKKQFNSIRLDSEKKFQQQEEKFVSQEKFEPVRLIVYGLVGLILFTVFGYLLKIILV